MVDEESVVVNTSITDIMVDHSLSGFYSSRRRRSAKKRMALSPLDSNMRDCDENGLALFKSCSSSLNDELWRLRDEIRQFRLSVDEHRESIHSLSDSMEQKRRTDLLISGPESIAPFDRFQNELEGFKPEANSQIGSLTKQTSQMTRICENRMEELVLRISQIESTLAEVNFIRNRTSDNNEIQDKYLAPASRYYEKLGHTDMKKDSSTASNKSDEAKMQQKRPCSGFISHWATVSRFSSLSQ